MELDHVLLAVDDLVAGATLLEDRFGLASVDGGRHPDWGTANRIVPLGSAYVELVAVDDPVRASRTTFGRWVASRGESKARLIGWAVRTSRIDEDAGRLGLAVATGSRTRPDGHVLSWRIAGVDRAAAEPLLPFLIAWGEGTPHPGGASATHRSGPAEIVGLELVGDEAHVAAWLDGYALPVEVRPGPPGVASVMLTSPAGMITLDPITLGDP